MAGLESERLAGELCVGAKLAVEMARRGAVGRAVGAELQRRLDLEQVGGPDWCEARPGPDLGWKRIWGHSWNEFMPSGISDSTSLHFSRIFRRKDLLRFDAWRRKKFPPPAIRLPRERAFWSMC